MFISTTVPSHVFNPNRQDKPSNYNISYPYSFTHSRRIVISFSPQYITSIPNSNEYIRGNHLYNNISLNNYEINIPNDVDVYDTDISFNVLYEMLPIANGRGTYYSRRYTVNVKFDMVNNFITFTPVSIGSNPPFDTEDNILDNTVSSPVLIVINSIF